MPERFAIYYAPDASHPLWRKAVQWHGRDPLSGETFDAPVGGLARSELVPRSASARRYGFHATIKAPMELHPGVSRADLEAALADFATAAAPVAIGRLKLALIGGFVALIPAEQSPELTEIAGDIVEHFEPFRAPLGAEDLARRVKGGGLSARQVELLDRYGYPHVLEQFQMHLTLTDRLPEDERAIYRAAAAEHFGALAEAELVLDRLVLFHEPEPGAPFVRLDDYVFSGEAQDERIRA